jgi:hypothetical protein
MLTLLIISQSASFPPLQHPKKMKKEDKRRKKERENTNINIRPNIRNWLSHH